MTRGEAQSKIGQLVTQASNGGPDALPAAIAALALAVYLQTKDRR